MALPKLRGKVYGRRQEIDEIIAFLKSPKQHGAIYAFTCIGKTSLIRKFLFKNLNKERTASMRPELFEKVIYLDCQQYQNFQGIRSHFATLFQKALDPKKMKETDFLKHKIFPRLKADKILMIFDNFESWINDAGNFINAEIVEFLETFRNSEHRIRGLFVGWNPPDKEKNFNADVQTLSKIGDKLLEGMDKDSALALVRDEGNLLKDEYDEIDLHTVDEQKLFDFFEKIYYVPQAIQSMIWLVADENICFEQFSNDYLPELDAMLRDGKQKDAGRLEKLRPARALLEIQIKRLSENARYILSHLAFYNLKVPKEILLLDLADKSAETFDRESKELRKAFNLLDKSRLLKTEIETAETAEKNIYCELHGFIRETARECLPEFENKYTPHLENLADQMHGKSANAFNNKLFYKQLALAECWKKLEDNLQNISADNFREYQKDLADLYIALASVSIAETNAVNLTAEQIKRLRDESEKRYTDFINKYKDNPDKKTDIAVTYYNLGNLLDENPERLPEAEAKYNKAIELNPNDAEAYNNLGNLLARQKKDLDKAESYFRTAIKLKPDFLEAYQNLSVVKALYGTEDDKDEIFELILEILKLDESQREWVKEFAEIDFIRDDARFREIVGD